MDFFNDVTLISHSHVLMYQYGNSGFWAGGNTFKARYDISIPESTAMSPSAMIKYRRNESGTGKEKKLIILSIFHGPVCRKGRICIFRIVMYSFYCFRTLGGWLLLKGLVFQKTLKHCL
jgi:hypothetical protein